MNYREMLVETANRSRSLVCMGADPVIERIPTNKTSVEEKIFCFYEDIINALLSEDELVSAIKPNYAFYAQYGFEGLRALKRLIDFSKTKGFPTILDAKRGDIGKTSAAYSNEVFDFFGADAVTISPYMGSDSVTPFINRSKNEGKGVYILARTSNIGAADLQDLVTLEGEPLFLRTIKKTVSWAQKGGGNVGAVVGATSLRELSEIYRALVEEKQMIPLLIPGVGTQGGSAGDVVSSVVEASKGVSLDDATIKTDLLTIRINSSSGINYAYERKGTSDYAKAAVQAVRELNREIDGALRKEKIRLY
ncbi:MAG: orotidine-5'-phosphate decarboxylase [Candidatus Bathyarchaeota archaeon]|nr:MAG: orotidine-5'-phosphate decarboxylase [Candidatus Bathyarchaeota archaeon]